MSHPSRARGSERCPPPGRAAALLCALLPATLTTAAALPGRSAQEPGPGSDRVAFVDGWPGDLTCRVASAVDAGDGSVLLEVEVRNRARSSAEPILFAVESKDGELHRVQRCPLPHTGRHGRGLAPAAVGRYWLQVATRRDPKSFAVSVAAASFYDAAPAARPPVEVGALRQGTVPGGARTLEATFVHLRNTAGVPVDAILLATFTRPEACRGLLTVRLEPDHDGEVAFDRRPLGLFDTDAVPGVAIARVELVDWTTAHPQATAADATAPLQAAYDRWLCWAMPWPSGSGELRARYRKSSRGDGATLEVAGRFTLKDVAPPLIDIPGNTDLEARRAIEEGVERAFGDLRRRSWQELSAENRVQRADRQRVRLEGPGWEQMFGRLIELGDGAILGTAEASAPAQRFQRWHRLDHDGGYLVTGRDTVQLEVSREPVLVERWVFATAGPWTVPLRYRRIARHGEHRELLELTLQCGTLEQRGRARPAPPGGPDAAALEAAWDRGYRYPEGALPLQAGFDLRPSAEDAVWEGENRVRGELRVAAFGGLRNDGTGCPEPAIAVEHRQLDEHGRARLAAAVHDRLLQWSVGDFAGRPPFAAQFAGATVLAERDRPGTFVLGNCAIAEVEVEDGLVVRLRRASGAEQRIEWRRERDVMVPARVSRGPAVWTASWQRIEGDWLLPVQMQLEGLCAGGGKETLKLSRARLR